MARLMVFVYILILLFHGMKRPKFEARKKIHKRFTWMSFVFFFSFIFQIEMNYYHFDKCVQRRKSLVELKRYKFRLNVNQ